MIHLDLAVNCNKCLITPHKVEHLQSPQLSSAVKTHSWKRKLVLRATIETGLFSNLRQRVPISPTAPCQKREY